MESYVKGKIPQIIFGSKSAQKVSGLLKKYEIKKCLLVTGHHVVSRMKEIWKRPCMLVLMPTTSGTGAETTAGAVITSTMHGMKFSFGNSNISADIAVIDPEFTVGMPAAATVCGGIDALAHTIEFLVGTANNEYTNQILFLCLNKIWTCGCPCNWFFISYYTWKCLCDGASYSGSSFCTLCSEKYSKNGRNHGNKCYRRCSKRC